MAPGAGGEVGALADLGEDERRDVVAAYAADRHPLLAFGANGAPERLRARFLDLSERVALVLTGELHDADVGARASPTPFAAMPSASPGTAVRASVLWLTARQVTDIAGAELGSTLGRVEQARFVMDEAGVEVDDVSRSCRASAPAASPTCPASSTPRSHARGEP